jgi:NTE family protein
MAPKASKKISLALQGGGTHSAFTWGVIDQLLLDGRVEIDAVSATSGGAMLAAVLAQGLKDGDKEFARDHMMQFWKKISLASTMLPLRMKVVDQFLGNVGIDFTPQSLALDYVTRLFSPQQFNLFDINPLRGIVEDMVDFEWLNRKSPLKLFVNATNARTGKGRIFEENDLSLDAVMASSCLPFVFKAVEIEGESYWDGSFSACPALSPLANYGATDILLVQVHPSYVEDVPKTAADILDRATELSFHAVLLQEIKTIDLYNRLVAAGKIEQNPVFIHSIESDAMLASLGRSSKLNADWEFLVYLHDLGVQAATDWLERNYDAIGKDSSTPLASSAA